MFSTIKQPSQTSQARVMSKPPIGERAQTLETRTRFRMKMLLKAHMPRLYAGHALKGLRHGQSAMLQETAGGARASDGDHAKNDFGACKNSTGGLSVATCSTVISGALGMPRACACMLQNAQCC